MEKITCKDFSFKIPKVYGKNIKIGEAGQWEYGEFLFISSLKGREKKLATEGFFYYWTKEKRDFGVGAIRRKCRKIAAEFLFEPDFRLWMWEVSKASFMGYPAMRMKFRFSIKSPEVKGPLFFFIVDNIDQNRTYFLGILSEQGGDFFEENKVIQLLNENVIKSFKFT